MEKTVREHLKDLRRYLLIVIIPFVCLFFVLFFLSPTISNYLIEFLDIHNIVTLTPTESISTQINMALALTFVLIIPLFILSIYSFVKDEINKNIRKKVLKYVFSSYFLAIGGVLVGVAFFSKIIFALFLSSNIANPMWSIRSIVQFVIFSSVAFAVIMQIMIIIPVLSSAGIINTKSLRKARLPILIIILFLSAIVTPPDFISQILMAIPIYLSFELGLLITKLKGGMRK